MKAGQEEMALKLAHSAKRDPFLFRQKGNENQFRFCEDVEEPHCPAFLALKKMREEALSCVKNAVQQGMELLSRRKLIKLADRS